MVLWFSNHSTFSDLLFLFPGGQVGVYFFIWAEQATVEDTHVDIPVSTPHSWETLPLTLHQVTDTELFFSLQVAHTVLYLTWAETMDTCSVLHHLPLCSNSYKLRSELEIWFLKVKVRRFTNWHIKQSQYIN